MCQIFGSPRNLCLTQYRSIPSAYGAVGSISSGHLCFHANPADHSALVQPFLLIHRIENGQYNHIFEFDNCPMMGQTVSMKVTSVTGHLMEIEFAEPYGKKWNACQPVDLFTAPIIKYVKQVRVSLFLLSGVLTQRRRGKTSNSRHFLFRRSCDRLDWS